ncbi:unnamed protein product (macronuclear) [Paramecium tetraurelia]|uniref:DNA mismatch repair proteins mutS family domain-containing protein n=1 Tax=Paramecium tetraurelia TaxID=5888 RepID=A0CH16_PARTE|nr:uncharacterized protein GSPATT00007523001 [Paramecium tetraurelia]CAK70083.1 unnamed protein product [Paramecium tetraurelia]|eukprot:XP_001437480.1 hypothetical protein (macronuclear) [Paramecium tetraurelia strain d4-2]
MKTKKLNCFDVELSDNALFDCEQLIKSKSKSKSNPISDLTPLEAQYQEIKKDYQQDLVLLQRGSFFLAYSEDAHFIRRYIDLQWKIPNYMIGLNEASVIEHVHTLIMQTDRKIVFCEQSLFQMTQNQLRDRFITGIYSKGLLGFGILGENLQNIETNYLVSLYKNEAIVLDTISKVAYKTSDENLNFIKITEIITNEKIKTLAIKNAAKGDSAFEQLEIFFKERFINGISQITFIDNSPLFSKFCLISDNAIKQLFFKPLIQPVTKEGQRKLQMTLRKIPIDGIMDRQLAQQDMRNHQVFRDSFLAEIKRVGSLQHQMARVFNAPKDSSILKQFLNNVKYILVQLKQKIYINKQNYQSEQLRNLQELNDNILQKISQEFVWEGENLDVLVPQNQERTQYNQILESLEKVEDEANDEYLRIKSQLYENDPKITYQAFEIEMPEEYKTPQQLLFSNKRKGYRKYTTQFLQKKQQQHIKLLDQLKIFIQLFYQQVIENILKHKEYFQEIINQISDLDVLIAMSKYLENDQHKCLPTLSTQNQLVLRDFRHPLIQNCVPNNLTIEKCIVLTGYNGAGKSTILRSVGLLVILAMLGCYVPCQQMEFKTFNEIHCRMGAYDTIRESTFYVEMQEVRRMIDTQNSLLLIDELGRGTSSIDGHSLAYSILKYLLKQNSTILFTTHFDITLDQVVYYMEDYQLQKGQVIKDLTSKILI